jgi:hypothetical protein
MPNDIHGGPTNLDERLFDSAEHAVDSDLAEIVLTLTARSATIRSLTVDGEMLTVTIAARVDAVRLKCPSDRVAARLVRAVPGTDSSAPAPALVASRPVEEPPATAASGMVLEDLE